MKAGVAEVASLEFTGCWGPPGRRGLSQSGHKLRPELSVQLRHQLSPKPLCWDSTSCHAQVLDPACASCSSCLPLNLLLQERVVTGFQGALPFSSPATSLPLQLLVVAKVASVVTSHPVIPSGKV